MDEPPIPTPSGAEDWWPLRTIAEKLDISKTQMTSWAEPDKNNDFPKPKHTHGRFKFYDLFEVQNWVFFQLRATAGMGNSTLNEKNHDD